MILIDALKVKKEYGEKLKRYLARRNLLNKEYTLLSDNSFIYLPVTEATAGDLEELKKRFGAIPTRKHLQRRRTEQYGKIVSSIIGNRSGNITKRYDLLGNIAIIEADKQYARKIATAIMRLNKNVESVYRKAGAVSGRYRTREYKYVAGKRIYVATYKENGCIFKFDIRKVFFSPRLGYERGRIAAQAGDRENVIVMFAGVGPFAIEIAKKHRTSRVVAIELNRQAVRYMKENAILNKVENVVPVAGDVKKVAAKYAGYADRIVMPLPKSSEKFLEEAFKVAKRQAIVHYYSFTDANDPFKSLEEKLGAFFKARKAKISILNERIVRPYSARTVEVVIDFRIEKSEGF